jgi:hypothetical protein
LNKFNKEHYIDGLVSWGDESYLVSDFLVVIHDYVFLVGARGKTRIEDVEVCQIDVKSLKD